MSVDINWSMLTDASRNFGNALVGAASTIHDRRKESGDREATANYLQNPNDPAARQEALRRNPAQAMQIEDHHIERARSLRADQREQLDYIGQLLTGPDGHPISEADYPRALALAHQAGIDVAGHETYDPAFVGAAVQLHQRLHPVAPVAVGDNQTLRNPQTGDRVGGGAEQPHDTVIPMQGTNGGYLIQRRYSDGHTEIFGQDGQRMSGAPAQPTNQPPDHVNPATGEHIRFNPQTNAWEPLAAGGAGSGQPGFPGR